MRVPRANRLVDVCLPMTIGGQDVIEFRVVVVIDLVIALDPLPYRDTRLVPARVRDCYMTFDDDLGMVSVKGHLYQRTPGDWRFKVADTVPFPAGTHPRIRMCAPIMLGPYDEESTDGQLETETINFGTDGVLIEGAADWQPSERMRLTLSVPGEDEAIAAVGRLSARQGTLYDFKYETMDVEARGRLAAFIIEDQRAALHRRLASHRSADVGLDDDIDRW